MYTTDPVDTNQILVAGNYPVHRAANIVPLDNNFDALQNSLKRSGLIEPITLYKGEILDGRRRAINCMIMGIPIREDELFSVNGSMTEKQIYEFVLAKNNRRSLSKAQLAMIAAVEVDKASHKLMGILRAIDYAKEVWGVSKVTYEKARYILANDRGLAQQIFSTGFALIQGRRTTMVQVYEHVREVVNSLTLSREDNVGDQDVALFYRALDGFLEGQTAHISDAKIKQVLQQKIQQLEIRLWLK